MKSLSTKEEWDENEDELIGIAKAICDKLGSDYPPFSMGIRNGGICVFMPIDKEMFALALPLPHPNESLVRTFSSWIRDTQKRVSA